MSSSAARGSSIYTERKNMNVADTCDATMVSEAVPGHTHTCIGDDKTPGVHYCGECQRWWGSRGEFIVQDMKERNLL